MKTSELIVNAKGELRQAVMNHIDGFEIVGLMTWVDNYDSYKRICDKVKHTDYLVLKDTFS